MAINWHSLYVLCVKNECSLHVAFITGVARSIVVLEDGVLILVRWMNHVDLIFGDVLALIMV